MKKYQSRARHEVPQAIKRGSEDAIRNAQADKGTISKQEKRELINREAEKYAKKKGNACKNYPLTKLHPT